MSLAQVVTILSGRSLLIISPRAGAKGSIKESSKLLFVHNNVLDTWRFLEVHEGCLD